MEKKRVYKVLSLILFLLGIFFILNSQANLTGAVIGIYMSTGINYISGFIFIILSGSLLFVASKREEKGLAKLEERLSETLDPREKIRLIERAHIQGLIDDVSAANRINEILEGDMEGMEYKNHVKLTIHDGSNKYSLTHSKNDVDLAYAIYNRIIANNPVYKKNCQLHVSKYESTKDHRKGLRL